MPFVPGTKNGEDRNLTLACAKKTLLHVLKLPGHPGKAKLGDTHPRTLTLINNLASQHAAKGEFREAEVLYRESLEKGAGLPRNKMDNPLSSASVYHC